MKNRLLMRIIFTTMLIFGILISTAQQKPDPEWVDQKFSMFIHWGLYSELGGVWEGKPVTKGYSEQIQSFAGIFSDWYGKTASRFNPEKWDAEEVVKLAKQAGMKSIVFTSKHHDGFCMYHSKYTDFNIVEATPFKRDVMKELSDACHKYGVKFAIYYSLIDWHFPEAYPISSHNADPITPAHHDYSMKQVEEIMTNYGAISEIWFDMGSLRAEQSRELYDLVARLQPQCMVSGRLGNDRGDFAVMADNDIPDYKIAVPWQSAASFFKETWSYRSWQERGDINQKIEEKIKDLVRVVSRGGNYLLNIGPRGDGSVVEFERDALLAIGEWLGRNGEAIYSTESSPFEHLFDWGEVTRKDNDLYLFIEKIPTGGEILLKGVAGDVRDISMPNGTQLKEWKQNDRDIAIQLPENIRFDRGIALIKVSFKDSFTVVPEHFVHPGVFTSKNAIPLNAFSSMDYYSRFKSVVGYTWYIQRKLAGVTPVVTYTKGDEGKRIALTVGGIRQEVELTGGKSEKLKNSGKSLKWGDNYSMRIKNDRFGRRMPGEDEVIDLAVWKKCDDFNMGSTLVLPVKDKESVIWVHELISGSNGSWLVEIGAADAMQIVVNGETILKRTYTDGAPRNEIVMLPLNKGSNRIVVKLHNRYNSSVNYLFNPNIPQEIYTLRLKRINTENTVNECRLELAKPNNKNSDIGLRDLIIKM